MSAVLAIHEHPGSFSDRWIAYCRERGVDYKVVDCHNSGIVEELKDIQGLLWHWLHYDPTEALMARQVIASVEKMGIVVFPNTDTCWHYDDKVGQKYLLEALRAPLVPSYVWYDRAAALAWIDEASFPKVFKLRCGAGSLNVRLVKTRDEARRLCKRAFGRGFPTAASYFVDYRNKVRRTKSAAELFGKLKRMPASLRAIYLAKRFSPRQKGYAYFQDYLEGNAYDTRITVIGGRAFGFVRHNRPGDFRASGSGKVDYDLQKIDLRCVRIALDVAEKLGTQSLAFDFLFDEENSPRIGEISYCYMPEAVFGCPGFWDRGLGWHEARLWPQDIILEDLLATIGTGWESSPA